MARKKPIISPLGQWAYPGEVTIIPSSKITMKGVNYPVLGVDDLGNQQMMMPGQDYTFPGDYVTEYPQMGKGGLAQWFDPEFMFKNKYNTELTPSEEADFSKWAAKESQKQGRDILNDMGAYDVKGFWKSGDYKNMDSDNHGTDTWKKPNHPTFSNQSRYHGADGWYGGNWTDKAGYQPSKQTLETYGPEYYDWMFKSEPGRSEYLDMSRYESGLNKPTPFVYQKGGWLKSYQAGGEWLDDEPEVNPKIGWNSGNRYSYDKKGNLIYTNHPLSFDYDVEQFIEHAINNKSGWLGNSLNDYEIDFLKNAKNKIQNLDVWPRSLEFQVKTKVDKLNPSLDELINVTQNIYPDQYAIDNSFSKASKSRIDLPASAFENDIKERYVIPEILKNSINKRFGTLPTTRDDSYSPNRIWTTKVKNDEDSNVGARFAIDEDNSKYAYILTPNSKKTSDLSKEKINTKKENIENLLSSADNKFYENLYLKYPDYIQYPGNYNNPEISLFGDIKNILPNQMWNRAEQMRVEMLNNPEIKDWADLHNVNLSRGNEDSKQNLVIDSFAPKVPESAYANRLVKAGLPVSTPDYSYGADDTYIVQDPSKFNLAGYFPIPKDYDEENAKQLIAKKLGIKPEQLNNKDYLIHYNKSPITEYTPGKKYAGWLDQFQTGGIRRPIYTSNPRDPRIGSYRDSLNLYNSGEDYYSRLKKSSFDSPNIGVSEEDLKKARDENYKKYPWDKLKMPVSNEKSGKKFQPVSKYNIYVSDVGNIESNRYKKPVQPYIYKKPEVSPIYTSDINDPRLASYNDSLYLYKSAKNDFNKFNKLSNNFDRDLNDEEWQRNSDRYDKLLNLQKNKWHTADRPNYTANYPYKGPKSGLTIQPVGLEGFYREGYHFPRFKKPVQPYIYKPEVVPDVVNTPVVEPPKPSLFVSNIDRDMYTPGGGMAREYNIGVTLQDGNRKSFRTEKEFQDWKAANNLDISKAKVTEGRGYSYDYYPENKKYGGWLDQFQTGGWDNWTPNVGKPYMRTSPAGNAGYSDNARVVTPFTGMDDATRARLDAQKAEEARRKRSGVISQGTPETSYQKAKRKSSFVEQEKERTGSAGPMSYVLDVVNPVNYVTNAIDLVGNTGSAVVNASQGNFAEAGVDLLGAGLNALDVVPLTRGLGLGKIAKPAIKKVAQPFLKYADDVVQTSKIAGKPALPTYKNVYRGEHANFNTMAKPDDFTGRWALDNPKDVKFYVGNLKTPRGDSYTTSNYFKGEVEPVRIMRDRLPEYKMKQQFAEGMPEEARIMSMGRGKLTDKELASVLGDGAADRIRKGILTEMDYNSMSTAPFMYNTAEGILDANRINQLRKGENTFLGRGKTNLFPDQKQAIDYLSNQSKGQKNSSLISKYLPFSTYKNGGWLNKYQPGGYVKYVPPSQRPLTFQSSNPSTTDNTRLVTQNTNVSAANRKAAEAAEYARKVGTITQGTPKSDYEKAREASSLVAQAEQRKGSADPLDYVLDIVNPAFLPFAGIDLIGNTAMGVNNLAKGNFSDAAGNAFDAGLNALYILPAAAELRGPLKSAGKYLTTQTPLKNTYKYNPWAFKPNEANWYRQVGQSAIDDIQQTGLIREAGEEVSPRMWGEFQNQIKRLQGDDAILDYNERYMQQRLAGRRPVSPFFAKGELFYPMDKKVTMTKSGKISKNPAAKGTADYLIETDLANQSFQPAYVKGMYPGVPEEIGSTAILKPNPALRNIDNFKLYKRDWLRGYKPVDVPSAQTITPQSFNPALSGFVPDITNTRLYKGAFQKYPKGPLTQEEITAFKNSPEYLKRTKEHLDLVKQYGDDWKLPNYMDDALQEAIATGNRSRINPTLYGGKNWNKLDYFQAGVLGLGYPAATSIYGLAFSPPAVKNRVLKNVGVQGPAGGLSSRDTTIDITNSLMDFAKVNEVKDGNIIIGGEFIEDANNTVRKAKDWLSATDTYSDKQYPSKDIQSFYGVENGKFKVGKANEFNPNTEIVPRRFGEANISKAVLNGKEMRLLDNEGNPIYQNTPNTGKFILYSPSTGKSQFTYINDGKVGVTKVNDFLKKNKDAQYIHLDNGRYEYYGLNPEGLNEQDYQNYYEQDLKREGNPGYNLIIKGKGGQTNWLDIYQDAGEVPSDIERMQGAEIFKKRSWLDKLRGYVHKGEKAIGLDPYNERSDDFMEQWARRINTATGGKDWYKQPNDASGAGGIGTAMMETVMAPFSAPQLASVYGATGKVQMPSEAMNIQNPVGAFLTDAVLDPTNLVGAGIAKNLGKGSLQNMVRSRMSGIRPSIQNSVDNIATPNISQSASISPVSWQAQELPGLHLKSTMTDGPISKIVEPKTGLVNVEQALGIIGKESGGVDKVALIKQSLGENIPKKMDYNDFRKTVQDQLIPLEKQFSTERSDYGIDRLGYAPGKFVTKEVDGKKIHTYESDYLDNQTILFSNKDKFGRGSGAHSNPDETLGHAHYLIDKGSPDVLTVTQIQSDAFQGRYRIPIGIDNEIKELKNKLKYYDSEEVKNRTETPGNISRINHEIKKLEEKQVSKFNDNVVQKSLLDKNHQERYLQELVDYAGKQDYLNKVRVPTAETAAKVQNYRPVSQAIVGDVDLELAALSNNSITNIDDLSTATLRTITQDFDIRLSKINNSGLPERRDLKDIISDLETKGAFKKLSDKKDFISLFDTNHQTILKKYAEQPKTIKKLFGEEPKIVTDSKGNTWYEFDIPKKFKEGKGEIKAFSTIGGIGVAGAAASQLQEQKKGGQTNWLNKYK